MSLLTRTGTLVRKHRGPGSFSARSSLRRQQSFSAKRPKTQERSLSVSGTQQETEFNNGSEDGTRKHAVVSFDEDRRLVCTAIGRDYHLDDMHADYGAFMYQIREANKESENVIEFGCKTYDIICNTLLVTVLVGLAIALPITMVSMGVKYLEDCPKEPRIPVYLLVGGCFGLLKLLFTFWRNIRARRYQDIEVVFDDHDADDAFASTTYRTMNALLFLFLVGWHVVGSYWTAKIWLPHFEQLLHEPSNWCDRTVYMFTVYQICLSYGVMAVFVIVLISLTCWIRCR